MNEYFSDVKLTNEIKIEFRQFHMFNIQEYIYSFVEQGFKNSSPLNVAQVNLAQFARCRLNMNHSEGRRTAYAIRSSSMEPMFGQR